MRELPDLASLHERHRGLTPDLCRSYAEAAAVCFSRFHASPATLTLQVGPTSDEWHLRWPEPTGRQYDAWANEVEAIEAGAYSVALAAVEAVLGLVAIMRARALSGADYYAGPPGPPTLRNAFRLEVSGVGRGGVAQVTSRLNRKIAQVRRAGGVEDGLACVVGFQSGIIMVAPC